MRRFLAPALLAPALGLLLLALSLVRFSYSFLPEMPAEVKGIFAENGTLPRGTAPPGAGRYWSSGSGKVVNRGSLSLGPFVAPAQFSFRLAGFPRATGCRLTFENTITGEVFDPHLGDAGPTWRDVTLWLPVRWRGASVVLHAIDDADGDHAWIAVSQPYVRPAWAAWWSGVVPPLVQVLFTGALILTLATPLGCLLGRLRGVEDSRLLLVSLGAVAAIGYGLFFLFLLDHRAGTVVQWILLLLGLVATIVLRRGPNGADALWRRTDWRQPALLMAGITLLNTSLLVLYRVETPLTNLAANRFCEGLPVDNALPQILAARLRDGQSPIPFVGDWQSSDRPPLQAAWLLLTATPIEWLGADTDDSAQLSGLWFQVLWIPAAWGWCRAMRMSPRATALLVVVLAASSFFLINSIFVWPKLGAAAFLLGAFTGWFGGQNRDGQDPRLVHGINGALAGLGWLAHGGVAFALLAAGPLLLAGWRRGGVRPAVTGLALFLLFALPWSAYQNLYDPPGDRLLKWHLAGVQSPDERGTVETLIAEYEKLPVREIWLHRWQNVQLLWAGDWRNRFRYDRAAITQRRSGEFFYLLFALGWWNLGFVAAGVNALRARGRHAALALPDLWGKTWLWIALTVVVWEALLFNGSTAVIHVGSYTVPVALFMVLASALWRMHRGAFLVVAALQIIDTGILWITPPPAPAGVLMRTDALLALGISIGVLAWIVMAKPSLPQHCDDDLRRDAETTEPDSKQAWHLI